MLDLGFNPWLEQAVMVKHLTAGVRQTSFSRVNLNGASGRPKTVPTVRIVNVNDKKDTNQLHGKTYN